MQEAALEEMKKELQAKPTEKLVDDLRKKVKILQVVSSPFWWFTQEFLLIIFVEMFFLFLGYK